METASCKKAVWLIKDPRQSVSFVGPIKKIIGARRLAIFSSWEEVLRQPVKHSLPQLILIEGSPQASQIEEMRKRTPGVPLFGVTAFDNVHPMRSRETRPPLQLLPQRVHDLKHDYDFTVRERQILPLMVQGFIKREIAEHLSLSFHTVNNHERRIYRKLKVHTRSAAVAKALMEGL